jgi:hypothetical protein
MTIENADRYLRIMAWARRRYMKNGRLVISIGGKPSRYTAIERLAFARYSA